MTISLENVTLDDRFSFSYLLEKFNCSLLLFKTRERYSVDVDKKKIKKKPLFKMTFSYFASSDEATTFWT